MKDLTLPIFGMSPTSLSIVAAICVASLLAYQILRKQWNRAGSTRSARNAELAALAISSLCALLLVVYGDQYVRQRDVEEELQADMRRSTELAIQIRQKISAHLDAARTLLADRAQRKIADHQLAEARTELARFAAFNDPRIAQMIALIDKELAIRQLVEQSLSQTEPAQLALTYSRLAQLAPDDAHYRADAQRYSAIAPSANGAATTPTGK